MIEKVLFVCILYVFSWTNFYKDESQIALKSSLKLQQFCEESVHLIAHLLYDI